MPSAPSFVLMGSMIPDALVIAVVIFATNISLAKVFAKRNNYVIDSNQVHVCHISVFFSEMQKVVKYRKMFYACL